MPRASCPIRPGVLSRLLPAALLLGLLAGPPSARADEGMWTLDNLPVSLLKERYGFEPTPEWLENVRLACVRFNDGGSGAFVSPNGLVLTNHHVAMGQLQKMSSAAKDYVKEGFFARSGEEEMRCPDLELNQLVSMEDVTKRVLSAIKAGSPPDVQNAQRKAQIARIEKESMKKTGLRSDVVELYAGGEYWLYRYKKYTEIRLVMAPEQEIAFYGGDPDNFTYPRFDLDMAFFRVYENGKPVRSPHHFRWSAEGAKEGDLVFVCGTPGSTSRLETARELEYERDYGLPTALEMIERRLSAYEEYAGRGREEARRAKDRIWGLQNSKKALRGRLDGLLEPEIIAARRAEEAELRAFVATRPELAAECGGAWDRIAAAQDEMIRRHREWSYRPRMSGSRLADIAGTIVRYVVEVEKPNDTRYEEFRDSSLESLRFRLFSPAPVYKDMEEHMLAAALETSLEKLGADDPYMQAALGGRSPEEVAHDLITGTGLEDPAVRKALVDGGRTAVEASQDPLILWARGLDPLYREMRKWYEDRIESVKSLEGAKVAKARFARYGKSHYPDATFTLRLSYGKVAGFEEGTTLVPSKTTFYGLYDRAASFDSRPPFALPPRVEAARGALDLSTPLNFVTTNDIIGGNSGSPVFNRDAEYVGLVFDGNIQSLVLDYGYTEERARAVAVHSKGIVAALRAIYDMGALADELVSGSVQ